MTYVLPLPGLAKTVACALEEDLGRGDITTDSCIADTISGRCTFRARTALVVSGSQVLREVYAQVDPRVELSNVAEEGARVSRGAILARVEGPAASILKGERVVIPSGEDQG